MENSSLDDYRQYLNQINPKINLELSSRLFTDAENTNWDQPESALDLNNFAVISLIKAEETEELSLKSLNLEIALEALNAGAENHPLCAAHLALIHSLLGDNQTATQIAFSGFLNWLHLSYTSTDNSPLGLVYLPAKQGNLAKVRSEQLENSLTAKNGYNQALFLFSEVLSQAQFVFYNSNGLRFLQLAAEIAPNSVAINLQLGLSHIFNQRWEGLLYLHKSQKLLPDYSLTIQALYLAYRELKQDFLTKFWYKIAHNYYQQNSNFLTWNWASLSINSPFTYLPFDDNLLLAVEPSFRSIVTSVLLAQGDWFEAEMEFWRNQIQPGMTVIDVGANVGVYTFSAAQKVTETGKVFAVEPFSGCVQCLQETCRINELSWVKICAGAASDQAGTAKLSLNTASELNELVTDDSLPSANYEEINCFTLDSLITQENIQKVDWLKMDAEGHEMQVLLGSDRILTEFAPNILYENIAGAKGSNTQVAEYLITKGYSLFRYQPYLQQLIPLNSLDELQGNLNIIALPNKV